MPVTFGRAIRSRFLLEPGTAFLNHGSFGTTPRVVLAAADRWRRRMEVHPDRFLREEMPVALRRALSRLSAFLKVKERDLAFVENATTGANAVLRSFRLRRGDEVLHTNHIYNAVRQTIRHVCERSGAKMVEATIRLPVQSAAEIENAILEKIGKSTRLLVIDHIAAPTGLIFPVRRIARAARRRGIRVLVDGAHGPGQIPLDLPSLGVDWYTGNAHKWLFAARGCAFLWARRDAQRDLHPAVISHGYGKGMAAEFDWTGTRDFSAWLAVTEALSFYGKLGANRIRTHNHKLAVAMAERLSRAWDQPLDGPPEMHGSLIAIRLPRRLQRREPREFMAELMARHRTVGVATLLDGALWARLSAQVYNVPEDYERLRRAIASLT
jgi:isopenicillin-N epimerase